MTSNAGLTVKYDPEAVCVLTLDRPSKRNAFDDALIRSLTDHLAQVAADPSIRCVVLTGSGDTFSSGADLAWMQRMVSFDANTNRQDALALGCLMRTLYDLPQVTVARVNGSAFGGAVGLIACCDIAIGVDSAQLGLTEVKLGLAPAVISPYVVAALGARRATHLFLTGELFPAQHAQQWGLLTHCVPASELDAAVMAQLRMLLSGGPSAQRACKQLARKLAALDSRWDEITADLIAELRTSPEGQEGLQAFLQKRRPNWRRAE